MRVAVIGAFGQLGSDLVPLLEERAIPLGHADIEIADAAQVTKTLDAANPTHVINCAAYNLVDQAESDSEAAERVNALGPRNIAEWCARRGTVLMHLSTDYVFGSDVARSTPLTECDPTGPVNVYGRTKLAGEDAVRSLCSRHFIVRTCGLYGHRATRAKGNFVETMLRLGRERPELRIVADQLCTPTSTADLARVLVTLLEADAFGTYHATNSGDCSWYEFAREIFTLSQLNVVATPITAAEYGAKARRPQYSVLDCSKLAGVIGATMPHWRDALSRYLRDRRV